MRRIIAALTVDHPDLALTKGISTTQLAEIRALLARSVPLVEIAKRLDRSPRSIEQALSRDARAKRDSR
jgi:IS30 family transposase